MTRAVNSNSHTILVVDDEALIRWSLRQKLEAAGFQVVEAVSGVEAIATFTELDISAVLLDVRLPDANGIQVLKTLREGGSECCVWLMTAYKSSKAEKEAAELGVEGFLYKPFDMDALIADMLARMTE